MKISYYDDKIIIYMNNKLIYNIDFNDKISLNEYFKNIFITLKNILEIELKGYYLVKVYQDINGVVIEMTEEDNYDLYDEIDMRIIVEETTFLYQIEDIFIDKKLLNKSKILEYNHKLYLKINNEFTDIEIGCLYEISNIIYKNTENIIKYSRELPSNLL